MASNKPGKPAQNSPHAYQDRARQEKEELDQRIVKLEAFSNTGGETYHRLPEREKELQAQQLQYMKKYSKILSDRIANFPTPRVERDRGKPEPEADDLGLDDGKP